MVTNTELYNFVQLEDDGRNCISQLLGMCKVQEVSQINVQNINNIGTKEVVAKCLANVLRLVERQHVYIINQKEEQTKCQGEIIRLQSEIIERQENALDNIKVDHCVDLDDQIVDRLSNIVKESVETKITKSYSEIVQSHAKEIVPQSAIKSVARQIVKAEEIGRNIMVFGLTEAKDEVLSDAVGSVFESLNEKPKFEAVRLGKARSDLVIRPIKVTMSNSLIVQQILTKSRNLSKIESYKKVFLSPDRPLEERIRQKELIVQLKTKIRDEPNKNTI